MTNGWTLEAEGSTFVQVRVCTVGRDLDNKVSGSKWLRA